MPTIKLRRDSAADWTSKNPVLAEGEPGLELDTGKVKYGDGATAWNLLPYSSTGGGGTGDLDTHINDTTPHPVYDDGPSLVTLYQNAKV